MHKVSKISKMSKMHKVSKMSKMRKSKQTLKNKTKMTGGSRKTVKNSRLTSLDYVMHHQKCRFDVLHYILENSENIHVIIPGDDYLHHLLTDEDIEQWKQNNPNFNDQQLTLMRSKLDDLVFDLLIKYPNKVTLDEIGFTTNSSKNSCNKYEKLNPFKKYIYVFGTNEKNWNLPTNTRFIEVNDDSTKTKDMQCLKQQIPGVFGIITTLSKNYTHTMNKIKLFTNVSDKINEYVLNPERPPYVPCIPIKSYTRKHNNSNSSNSNNNDFVSITFKDVLQSPKIIESDNKLLREFNYTPLINKKNSCYLNAGIQLLFSIDAIRSTLRSLRTNDIKRLRIPYPVRTDAEIISNTEKNYQGSQASLELSLDQYKARELPKLYASREQLLKDKPKMIRATKEKLYALTLLNFSFKPHRILDLNDPHENTSTIYKTLHINKIVFDSQEDSNEFIKANILTYIQYVNKKIYNEKPDEISVIKHYEIHSSLKGNTIQDMATLFFNDLIFTDPIFIILSINRNNYETGRKDIKEITANPEITIHSTIYKLKCCIIHIGVSPRVGHYIFLNFDHEGKPLHIIDDSNVYAYNGDTTNPNPNPNHNYKKNGYVFLYEQKT